MTAKVKMKELKEQLARDYTFAINGNIFTESIREGLYRSYSVQLNVLNMVVLRWRTIPSLDDLPD